MIEKIVADYETCRKAWDIGLRIESVFSVWFNTWGNTFDVSVNKYIIGIKYPAPTAEEVPLPPQNVRDYEFLYVTRYEITYETQISLRSSEIIYIEFPSEANEATARLKMAIWLCENVPEAREWYVANGYLVNNND